MIEYYANSYQINRSNLIQFEKMLNSKQTNWYWWFSILKINLRLNIEFILKLSSSTWDLRGMTSVQLKTRKIGSWCFQTFSFTYSLCCYPSLYIFPIASSVRFIMDLCYSCLANWRSMLKWLQNNLIMKYEIAFQRIAK